MRTPRGRTYVNQSISFPPLLLEAAKARAHALGLSFSSYVQRCVETELARMQPLQLHERPEFRAAVAERAEGETKPTFRRTTPSRKGPQKSPPPKE